MFCVRSWYPLDRFEFLYSHSWRRQSHISFFQGNNNRRHRSKKQRQTAELKAQNSTVVDFQNAIPVLVDLSSVSRKSNLIKILPALAALQGNVNYDIVNRRDKLFFLREKNGVNALHAKCRKLDKGMSYHIDIEATPVHSDAHLGGHDVHLGTSIFQFYVYVV